MAQIVKPVGATKKKTIVGRGQGSKGRACGRGHDGQNTRSGGGVRPGFGGGQMPLYRRVARRGFSNSLFKVTYQAVSKWENGTSDPSTSNLLALAKLYGVSAEEILGKIK